MTDKGAELQGRGSRETVYVEELPKRLFGNLLIDGPDGQCSYIYSGIEERCQNDAVAHTFYVKSNGDRVRVEMCAEHAREDVPEPPSTEQGELVTDGGRTEDVENTPRYKDPWYLREEYVDKKKSIRQIAGQIGCGETTVRDYLKAYDIPIRSQSEAQLTWRGNLNSVSFSTRKSGYEAAKSEGDQVFIHRLAAVAKFGIEEVKDKDVHHKSGVHWDNRLSNLEVMTHSEHMSRHRKVTGLDRLRIAEFYENGDISSYDLADYVDYDICARTVRDIHSEFIEGGSA